MKLEDFNNLSDTEKETYLGSIDKSVITDLEAERDSFKTENEQLQKDIAALKEENKRTKELNFTLGRKLNVEGQQKKSAEDILHDMFKKEEIRK